MPRPLQLWLVLLDVRLELSFPQKEKECADVVNCYLWYSRVLGKTIVKIKCLISEQRNMLEPIFSLELRFTLLLE